jgi:hypothetical protein
VAVIRLTNGALGINAAILQIGGNVSDELLTVSLMAVHLDPPERPTANSCTCRTYDAVPGVAGEFAGHLDGSGDVARRKMACHVHREDDGLIHGIPPDMSLLPNDGDQLNLK